MCVEISNESFNVTNVTNLSNKKTMTYSIKRLFKQLFKHQKCQKLEIIDKNQTSESVETLDNNNNVNTTLESKLFDISQSTNILENSCEKDFGYLSDQQSFEMDPFESLIEEKSYELEDFDFSYVSTTVPVHFMRTDNGTFFWTANTEIPADNDLPQPMSCSTNNQIACRQNRWTQV
ncbi:enhancer of split m4 protein-like [Haematobia irritans]|uniref:enhancer of split m4 protein-like n=1 Tax=Haematobia irritans TaxID=7368 RepID=UPI003F4F75A9